jgi:hypothetical protein
MRGMRFTPSGRSAGRSTAGVLGVADPASLVVSPEDVGDPVLRIVLERARSCSGPGDRSDPHWVCLTIEGGGRRDRRAATHVPVLRSRPAPYRKPALSELGQMLALRDDPRLVEVLKARAGVYNRQADELEQRHPGREHGAHVLQIAVPDHMRLIGRLESNGDRVTQAVRSGARAVASAIFRDEIDISWQPVICRTTPPPASAPSLDRDEQAVSRSTSAAEASA